LDELNGRGEPHLADDLKRMHKVVSRALCVSRSRGAEIAARGGFPDELTGQGYSDYVRCLLAVLRSHHDAEETIVFPKLRAHAGAVAEVPFERMDAEHRTLVSLLDAGVEAIGALLVSGGAAQLLIALGGALGRIEEVWRAHTAIEEGCLTAETVNRALSAHEQADVARAIGEHAARTSKPEELVLPFILFNLEPGERAVMAGKLPPAVFAQLIPGPWKERWAPMRQFLIP
jgi:hemerythrin-like domain-containing protein